MECFYTDEKNTLILIDLLKKNNIRKVVASPGSTNIRFVMSMQNDPFFQMYSVVDERSAAYIACGLAEETGEPIVLSCTGATASRNYMSGLTEAFYRKLPILAVTSTQHIGRIGQNMAQVIDRSVQLKDIAKLSVQIPTCNSEDDIWSCNVLINQAILELKRKGGGPVHINLETTYSSNFNVKKLPNERKINRFSGEEDLPTIVGKKIGIFVGTHSKWVEGLKDSVEEFCEKYNAVVLCDHTSNYHGKYKVLFNLITDQTMHHSDCNVIDLLIYIGNISGAYPNFHSSEQWRVNPDGEIRDIFYHLTNVFEMEEKQFFDCYNSMKSFGDNVFTYMEWLGEYQRLSKNIPQLPFSNIWIAKNTSAKLPENAILHLGILNSLRSWNYFEIDQEIRCYCNTGGFGIDGILSSAIGAALGCLEKIVFCVLGDLAFFYDMNSLGNKHLPNNLRILLINNGRGTEFTNYNNQGALFGDRTDEYIAAADHFGAKSVNLVKNYVSALGIEYLTASNKEEYLENIGRYISAEINNKPMVFEVFTDSQDESEALRIMHTLLVDKEVVVKQKTKKVLARVIGEKGVDNIRKILKK